LRNGWKIIPTRCQVSERRAKRKGPNRTSCLVKKLQNKNPCVSSNKNHHARREPLRFSLQATERLIVALGSELDVPLCPHDVRFTPESGHWLREFGCPLCAKSGHSACSKERPYSITSSARANRVAGIVTPIALDVFKLMTNSNLVGCSTGISSALVPRRMLSAISARRAKSAGKFDP